MFVLVAVVVMAASVTPCGGNQFSVRPEKRHDERHLVD